MFKKYRFLIKLVFIIVFFLSCSKVPELDRGKIEEANKLNLFGAELMTRFGLYEESIPFLKRSSKMNPSDYEPLGNLGVAYMKLDKLDKSLLYFNKSVKLYRHNKEIYYYLGIIYFKKFEYKKSFENFEKVIAIYESNKKKYTYSSKGVKQESILITTSWFLAGIAADHIGKWEKAIKYSVKAMNEFQKVGDTKNFKAANNKVIELINKYRRK
jgi:tetratricopeptide (TPR) repeat protein